jgi:DNA-binding transcriptional LysR family regulator
LDKFSAIQSFIVIAEQGSFAAAARQLGVTASIWTRRITGLGYELNVTLLAHCTRQLALTPAAQTYLARCRKVL